MTYGRSKIMKEAHRMFRRRISPKATFSYCLKMAWARAKEQRAQRLAEEVAFERLFRGGEFEPAYLTPSAVSPGVTGRPIGCGI